ncbi:hypothetical protein FKM82_010117 [Ascaphus truei]
MLHKLLDVKQASLLKLLYRRETLERKGFLRERSQPVPCTGEARPREGSLHCFVGAEYYIVIFYANGTSSHCLFKRVRND